MVLVAPAIIAPLVTQNPVKDNQRDRNKQKQEKNSDSNNYLNPFIRLLSMLSKLTTYIAQAIIHMLTRMGDMVNSLYKKALCAFLRSAIGVMLVICFLHYQLKDLND
jgi:hypothetical protein